MRLSLLRILRSVMPFSVMLWMIPGTVYSQWIDPDNGVVVEPSAAVWQFMQYGNTPVSYYTGGTDVSVPLYTYDDYEFNIPIVLNYAFSGQRPNDPAGLYGLGWVLNAGGCITRQVNNLPDDFNSTENSESVNGFYSMYENQASVPYFNSSGWPRTGVTSFFYQLPDKTRIEAEPDVFNFNFPGHSGKFILWANREIVVFDCSSPKGTYTIEPVLEGSRFSGFVICTTDGFRYTFGCDPTLNVNDSIDFHDYNSGSWGTNTHGPQVMWPLVSIESPGGRKVGFEYVQSEESVVTAQPASYLVQSTGSPDDDRVWTHIVRMNEQKQKSLYLKRISLADTFEAVFDFSTQRHTEFYKDYYGNASPMVTDGILRSVTIRDLSNGAAIRTVTCSYREGHPNKVPILESVKLSDVGEYIFGYWREQDNDVYDRWTPCKGTCNIDHWGYYNGYGGRDRLIDFFPSSTVTDNEETITGKQREPNFDFALCGALRFVYYPTRGRTEFIYEPNDYSVAIIKSGIDAGIPRPVSYGGARTAGGIRIKRIIDCDYNPRYSLWIDTVRVRDFSYEVNGHSTGILLQSPRYRCHQITNASVQSPGTIQSGYMASSDMLACIDTDRHIEYQQVTETNRDGSYCKYVYSTYATTDPNLNNGIPDVSPYNYESLSTIIGDMYKYMYMRPGSRKTSRGKLLSKTIYYAREYASDPEKPSYSEQYRYVIPSDFKWAIRLTRNYWYEYPIMTGECPVSSSVKTTYIDGTAVTNSVDYEYDHNTGFVTQVQMTDAAGKITKQSLQYADRPEAAAYGYPLPEQSHFEMKMPEDTDFRTTGIDKYVYCKVNTASAGRIPRMTEHWKTDLDRPKIYLSEAEEQADLTLAESMLPSASRILEYKDKAGNVTTYIYSRDYCNLLAVVQNVTREQTLAVLQDSSQTRINKLSVVDEQALRNLPGASVTTYTYIPMTGVASVTGPSGSKQIYSYDAYRRLSSISGGACGQSPVHKESEYKYQLSYE